MLFHHLASAFGAVFAQPVPIDPLLPVQPGDAEIRSHDALPLRVLNSAHLCPKNPDVARWSRDQVDEFPLRFEATGANLRIGLDAAHKKIMAGINPAMTREMPIASRPQYLPFTIFCRCSPTPSTPRVTPSPAFKNFGSGFMPRPTPGGVPVMMTSPGSMTKYCEQAQTMWRQSKIMVLVLPRWRFSPLTSSHIAS